MIVALAIVAIAALVLPLSAALVLGTLLVTAVADYAAVLTPVAESGGAELHLQDFALLILAARICGVAGTKHARAYVHPLFIAVAVYLGTLLATTMLAGFRDSSVFRPETAWFRLAAQVSPLFLFPFAVRTFRDFGLGARTLEWCGYLFAVSVFLAELLGRFGLRSETVQGDGFIRQFGPLGDQVAWVLPFFFCLHLVRQQIVRSLLFLIAILLTGGRGAVVALVCALAIVGWKALRSRALSSRSVAVALGITTMAALAIGGDLGGVRTRFTGEYVNSGLEQRLSADEIGLRVFLEHPIAGVGFTGYRFASAEYADSVGVGLSSNFLLVTGSPYVQVLNDGGLLAMAAFGVLVWKLLAFLRQQMRRQTQPWSTLAFATYVYLLAMLIGNQTAPWLLPGSLIIYIVFLSCGLLIAAERLELSTRYDVENLAVPQRWAAPVQA